MCENIVRLNIMMIEIALGILIAATTWMGWFAYKLYQEAAELRLARDGWEIQMTTLLSQKKSSEVKLGFLTEKLAPLLAEFPYDLHKSIVIPLGQPVDYIVIGSNAEGQEEIGFVEIKSNDAKHNANQRKIKKLVTNKQVAWYTVKIKGIAPEIKVKTDV